MQWRYPTAFCAWGEEETAAMARVIVSGRFTQGEEVAAFEREFAAYHGMKHAVMVNSGSSANLIMVGALAQLGRIKPGDMAIVPAIAWSTTYAPLIQYDLELMVMDVDDTWNGDPTDFEHLYLMPTSGIVVGCSILGNPAYLPELQTLASNIGATLIEDNCESLGALRAGKKTGTYGLMSSSSFFWSHQIGAIEGGMVLTNDDECVTTLRILRAHGWTRDVDHPAGFEHEYDFRCFGYNVRGLELHAAIGRAQLAKLDEMNQLRRTNVAFFWGLVGARGLGEVRAPAKNGLTSPFGIAFEVDAEKRPDLVSALRAEGIDCRLPTGGSFTCHPYGAKWRDAYPTPVADRIHRGGLFLGNGALDLTNHIEHAVTVIERVVR